MKYNKLVRDNIPNIITKAGSKPLTHIASNKEYIEQLHAKFREEVDEFTAEPSIEEMADIFEVITAINAVHGWNIEDIVTVQKQKREERGAFEEKIILDEVL